MLTQFLMWLISLLPSDTITINGKPYLTRYYLLLRDWQRFNIYLHHFHSSDQGIELHNHPWKWALSFIVAGGYFEEKRVPGTSHVTSRLVPPMSFNVVKHGLFHRVDLVDETRGSWSLFVAGPRITTPPEWGFWDRNNDQFKYYKENPEAIP